MGDLSASEQLVINAARDGTVADFKDLTEKTVSAAFLRALLLRCLSQPAEAPLGLRMRHAIIRGTLDLRHFGSIGRPLPNLELSDCTIQGKLLLENSCWQALTLDRSTVEGLEA